MQIVNPLRAALPYITLQTAKVQHCWADYFIFRGFAGPQAVSAPPKHAGEACVSRRRRLGLRPPLRIFRKP